MGALPSLTHYFPLRETFDVQISLPRDLTPEEAKRIAAWLAAMALEEPWRVTPAEAIPGEGSR